MNALLSMIVAVVMALTGMTAQLSGPASVEATVALNRDVMMAMIPGAGETATDDTSSASMDPAAMAGLGIDVLNGLTIRGTADQQVMELELSKGDASLISIGLKNGENGITLASNLLSGVVLNLPQETIAKLMEEMAKPSEDGSNPMGNIMQAIQSIDYEKMSQELSTIIGKLTTDLNGKIGAVETGEFTVDGVTFTMKAPVNITFQELATMALTLAKDLVSMESIKPALQAIPMGTDPVAEIEKKLQELATNADAQKIDLEIATYANEEAGSYLTVDMHHAAAENGKQEHTAHIGAGSVDAGTTQVVIQADHENMALDLTMGILADGTGAMTGKAITHGEPAMNMDINVLFDGTGVISHVDVENNGQVIHSLYQQSMVDDYLTCSMTMLMDGLEDEILDIEMLAGPGGEIETVFEGEDLKQLNVEDLLSGQNEEATATLMTSFMTGAMTAVSNLISQLPPESAAILGGILGAMSATPTPAQ